MCEPTSVIKELQRLKSRSHDLAGQGNTELALIGLRHRIDILIKQLDAAGEGNSWYDLEAIYKKGVKSGSA